MNPEKGFFYVVEMNIAPQSPSVEIAAGFQNKFMHLFLDWDSSYQQTYI